MKLCALTFALLAAAAVADPPPERVFFSRVFPVPGQIRLFVANADGSDEHPLLATPDIDYDPAWSPDGAWIVFTSERAGSADLFEFGRTAQISSVSPRVPAYDDQAAFSPDGQRLVFVTSRADGTADLWTLDLKTRRAQPLTSGAGGDFRPSWSPDGRWIAFASDRGSSFTFSHGRWEPVQLADIFLIHADGSGLKRIGEHGDFCGSPKWSADSGRVIAYCMPAQQTMDYRQSQIEDGSTRLVSIDVATGMSTDVPAGSGVKMAPAYVGPDEIGFIRKDQPAAGIRYASGKAGPKGSIRSAAWSPDGARVAFHRSLPAAPIAASRCGAGCRATASARWDATLVRPVGRAIRGRRLRPDTRR